MTTRTASAGIRRWRIAAYYAELCHSIKTETEDRPRMEKADRVAKKTSRAREVEAENCIARI